MAWRGERSGWWARWVLACVIFWGGAQEASAQILGRVVDRATQDGVPEASVLLLTDLGDVVGQTVTDSVGAFWFLPVVDSATYTLQVVADGTVGSPVDPIEYRGRAAHRVVILDSRGALERPVPIEGLEVTVDAQDVRLAIFGFYQREERGFGTFLEPEDFADAATENLTSLVRGLPGVLVLGEREILMQRNWKRPSSGMAGARGLSPGPAPQWRERYCTPSIWINGEPDWWVERTIRDGGRFDRMAGASVNNFLPVKEDIVGIEVYRSRRSVPREMLIEAERKNASVDGDCGIILIWTR